MASLDYSAADDRDFAAFCDQMAGRQDALADAGYRWCDHCRCYADAEGSADTETGALCAECAGSGNETAGQ